MCKKMVEYSAKYHKYVEVVNHLSAKYIRTKTNLTGRKDERLDRA